MTKTKLGAMRIVLTVVLVVALMTALCLNFAFAEGEAQTREFNPNFDRELMTVSNGTTDAVKAYRSLSWEAGQCSVPGDHPILKAASGLIQDGGVTAFKMELRSPDGSITKDDLKFNIHLSDPLNLVGYVLSDPDIDVSFSEGTDIGTDWTTMTIDFVQSEIRVNDQAWNSALEGAWAGFHLTAKDDSVGGKLDIRTVSIVETEQETVIANFSDVMPNYWHGSDDGKYVDVPAHFEITSEKEIVSTVATSNNTDEAYDAIVLRIAGSGNVTIAPVVNGVAGEAKAYETLTDLEGNAVAALDGTYRNAVISLASLGAKNVQGVKIAVSGGTVNVCGAFFTNMANVVPDKYFPTLDPETITYMTQFNFEYTPEHDWSQSVVEACAAFNCDYIISYGSVSSVISDGHVVLDPNGADYANLKLRSKVASEGKEYLVIKYKLEGRTDLNDFRMSVILSDPDDVTAVVYATNFMAGTALPSLSEINPYTTENGYNYLVVDLAKTFGTTKVSGVNMYISGQGKMLIDEIYYCDPVLPKIDEATKIVFDDYSTALAEGGYWWTDISAPDKVTVEDGALKVTVPAATAVCVGGAKPVNNKDAKHAYMVLRMKGDVDMGTFRIAWLNDTTTFFNQGTFKTMTGKEFVLTDEYQEFVIDLDASGIDRAIEGYRLWLGGWNATEGTLYIDEVYFADAQEIVLDEEHKIVFDDYASAPSTENGYWWTDISAPDKVTVEDGALKVTVPAATAVCVGGARPENNKDASYRYMVLRMKGDVDMGTFRIVWLDGTTTYFNQDAFKTLNGKQFVLSNEYQEFAIDLDASGIDRAIEGYRLWLGGWNATEGTLYVDEVYFAPAIGDIVVLPTNDDTKPVLGEVNVPATGKVGTEITVSATATDNYDAEVVISYEVTIGTEQVTVTNGKFTPQKAGTYNVKVIATDKDGNSAEIAKQITVEPLEEPTPEGLTTGAIIAIVVACVAVAAGAVVAVVLIRKKKQAK